MKSSFVRKGAASSADVGTRPGLHGQTLISTGLADWDKLLGGGLPLGTLALLIEDCHSQQHINLLRYFLAEGVMTNQKIAWYAPQQPSSSDAVSFLPALVQNDGSSPASNFNATGTQEADDDNELRIAWQYRKYIAGAQQRRQQEEEAAASGARTASRPAAVSGSTGIAGGKTSAQKALDAGVSRQWCHTYDLSRSMDAGQLKQQTLNCQTCNGELPAVLSHAQQFIQQHTTQPTISASGFAVPVRGPQPVGRVVIQSLLSPVWQSIGVTDSNPGTCQTAGLLNCAESDEQAWQAVAAMLYSLRRAVQDARCAVLVTLQADLLPPAWLRRLQHLSHLVMTLSSITDASDVYKLLPDPTSAAALLSFQKLPQAGMLAPKITSNELYVVRHKRKKLTLTPVDVDVDAQAKQQEAIAAATASLNSKLGIKQETPAPARAANLDF